MGTWGNLGEIRGGVACWITKAAIYLFLELRVTSDDE